MRVKNMQIWKISPGDRGRQWKTWFEHGVAAIGFSFGGKSGDINQYLSLEHLVSFYREMNIAQPNYNAKQLWQFAHSIKVGDLLVAYKLYGILDIGIVTGKPIFEYDELAMEEELYCYRRPVKWFGLDYQSLKNKSARKFMSRNMTLFLVTEKNTFAQIRTMLSEAQGRGIIKEDVLNLLDESQAAADIEPPKRVETTITRIIRDTAKSREVKNIHQHRCQICGKSIIIPGKGPYSEVHHIQPLGSPHNGPDDKSNMLCLCPMHHAEMDLGVLYVEPESQLVFHSNERNRYHLKLLRSNNDHVVNQEYLAYHKQVICKNWSL